MMPAVNVKDFIFLSVSYCIYQLPLGQPVSLFTLKRSCVKIRRGGTECGPPTRWGGGCRLEEKPTHPVHAPSPEIAKYLARKRGFTVMQCTVNKRSATKASFQECQRACAALAVSGQEVTATGSFHVKTLQIQVRLSLPLSEPGDAIL